MSDTILSGRWAVYYESETRQKRLKRDTSTTPTVTDTVQALYSALMDLFDSTMPASEGTPMKFDTPTQYKIGIIDSGDKDPWFIDRESVEYLSGGSLETVSWARVQDSNVGVVTVGCSGTGFDIVAGDIGHAISHSDGDAGTLLDVIHTATLHLLVIRPSTFGVANNWDSATGTITCNAHTATQNAAAVTGEQLWANIYTTGLATLQPNTVLAVFQGGTYLTRYKDTVDWWGYGDIDILVALKTTAGTFIDGGYLTVKADRALTSFSYFITGVSGGGRNPIPLTCGSDLNNVYGNRQQVLTDASGSFTVGEVITDDTDSTISGVVTASSGAAPNVTIQYYLIGGLDTSVTPQQKDFANGTGSFTGASSGKTATAVDPTDVHGASALGTSITFAHTQQDINEDGVDEFYSITIDCNSHAVADVYQWAQYLTRFGGTTTTNTNGIQGEQYIGSDFRLRWSGAVTGTISEGDTVIQAVSGATGTVVALNAAQKYMILRNSRGTFNTTNVVTSNEHSGTVTPNTAATVISPITAAPFGTFAGGSWYCAPGVVLINVPSSDVNKYQLTDDLGNTVARPLKVTATVGNTRAADWIAVFELTAAGGVIKKDSYTLDAAQGSAGSTSIKVDPDIASKVVGKSDGGIVRLIDAASGWEYRYRYVSWSGDVFTLFQLAGSVATGGSQTTLVDSGVDFIAGGVLRGDIVRNVTEGTYGYVTDVAQHTLTMTNLSSAAPVTDWNGDAYRIGVTVADHSPSNDKLFCPFIDTYETVGSGVAPGSESVLVTYTVDVPVRIKARQYKDIVPYSGDATIGSTGMNVNVIRTPDTVAT